MTLTEFTNVIDTIDIFKNLSTENDFIKKLFSYCEINNFRSNHCIVREGEFGDTMFMVLSGSVAVEKQTKFGDNYTVSIMDCSKDTHPFFGEIALIESVERTASVRAVDNCQCISINKESFEAITNEFPVQGLTMVRRIARALSRNLRKTTEDMLTLFDALILELGNN